MLDAHFHLNVSDKACGILCTSDPKEWAEAANHKRKGVIPSLGVLPPLSHIDLQKMEGLLSQRKDLQIGEIGLDDRFSDKEGQLRQVREILAIARNLKRMVSIHVVGNVECALSLIEGTVPILWHGFSSSVEIAKKATDKGALISLGPRTVKTKLWKRLREIGDLPFTVESDATKADSYEENLQVWYETLSRQLGWERKALEAHAKASLRTVLGNLVIPVDSIP